MVLFVAHAQPCPCNECALARYGEENDRLTAEIERLRAALRHIKDGTWNRGTEEMLSPYEYARRALSPSPSAAAD